MKSLPASQVAWNTNGKTANGTSICIAAIDVHVFGSSSRHGLSEIDHLVIVSPIILVEAYKGEPATTYPLQYVC